MPKIVFDPLVFSTSERLYGLNALIEMVYRATPEVERQERDELKHLAENENWEYSDYSVENQLLDVKFTVLLPKLAAYSIIVLLSSIVETQLLAYARRVRIDTHSPFEPNDIKGSVLERTSLYVKKTSGVELTKNMRWKLLRDLQDIRDTIVHRSGKPAEDKRPQFQKMCKEYPGVSLDENRITTGGDEIGITIHSCRYLASEVEQFFQGLFNDAGYHLRSGIWPNIQSGFSKSARQNDTAEPE
jgi:hypothetical protein